MTKDEALDLALEALEGMDILFSPLSRDCTQHNAVDRARKAITAIKQARSAPVQEPIGYLFQHEETGLTTVVDVQQVEWGFEKNNPRHQKIGPVYTTPPAAQRQWVGLTDEERMDCIFATNWSKTPLKDTAKLIEAKLKEKNT